MVIESVTKQLSENTPKNVIYFYIQFYTFLVPSLSIPLVSVDNGEDSYDEVGV
jgi:hypothetical protein